MKPFLKFKTTRLGLIILLGILLGGTLILWFSLQFTGKNRTISKLDIQIKPDTGVYFITVQDATNLVTKTSGNPIGQNLSQLNLAKIEGSFRRLPQVSSAQAFATLDGKLKIQIVQRTPVLRIQNSWGETYYIDSLGYKIPYRGNFAADIPAANGFIHEKYKDSVKAYSGVLQQMLIVANFIKNHPFWNQQFEQCYVDNFGDIILVPRVGRHSIVIGSPENLAEKMENLRIFYIKALNNLGWNKYSEINLKYKDQIVAVRNGKETEHITTSNVQKPQH